MVVTKVSRRSPPGLCRIPFSAVAILASLAGGCETGKTPQPSSEASPFHDVEFPPPRGADPAKLAVARNLHRAALELYRRRDRPAADAKASEALNAYADARAMVPQLSALHYELVVSLVEAARPDEAAAACRSWIERFPQDETHLETLGKIFFRSGRYGEAAKALEEILRLKPGDASTLRRIVEARTLEGSRDEALRSVEVLLSAAGPLPPPRTSAPPRADEWENLITAARSFARFREHDRALPLWNRLRDLKPADNGVRLECGRALKAVGRHAEALAMLTPLHGDPLLGAEALEESAGCHAREGRPAEAARCLVQALEWDATRATAYHLLADCLRRLGDSENAEAMERAATALGPSNRERIRVSEHRAAGRQADALYAAALAFSYAGKYREAEEVLSRPEDRQNPEVAIRRAGLYLDWLRAREAVEILEALPPTPNAARDEVEGLLRRARSFLAPPSTGDLARDPPLRLRHAVANSTRSEAAPLLIQLAAAEALRDEAQAVAAARLACVADPRSVEARRTLSGLLRSPEQLFLALESWKALLLLAPGDAEAVRGVEECRARISAFGAPKRQGGSK